MRRNAIVNHKLILGVRIILGIVLIAILWSLSRSLFDLSKLDDRLVNAQREIAILMQENNRLQVEADKVEDGMVQEGNIRDKLGLAKEGEVVVIIPGLEDQIPTEPVYTQESDFRPTYPVWRQWIGVFFDL